MSLDGKLLGRAKARLEEKKRAKEAELAQRLKAAGQTNPKILELDQEIKSTVIDVIGFALSGGQDPETAIEDIREDNLFLQSELKNELMAAGFPPDYLEETYLCPVCHDAGFVGTRVCSCLMELYREEQRRALSSLLKLGQETFDSFDLDYYDDTPDPATGVSPRHNMEFIYENCLEYARKFGKNSCNLLLNGGTGLGKTFLSACIARDVSERGFSVVYDTSNDVFSKLEDEKFSKGEDLPGLRDEIRRFATCDLLILDDLGTEMTTAFTVSALYNLINARLISGKKTVINSNLSVEELRDRYSPQIMSRLEGEFQILTFYGRDIRLLKKEQY